MSHNWIGITVRQSYDKIVKEQKNRIKRWKILISKQKKIIHNKMSHYQLAS